MQNTEQTENTNMEHRMTKTQFYKRVRRMKTRTEQNNGHT